MHKLTSWSPQQIEETTACLSAVGKKGKRPDKIVYFTSDLLVLASTSKKILSCFNMSYSQGAYSLLVKIS